MALLATRPTFWYRVSAIYILLLIIFFSHNFVRSNGESTGDEVALITFKSFITYDPDGALASWGNNSLHYCSWFGVICSNQNGKERRVIALELKGIDLAGSISPSLGNLTFLEYLDISETQISGSIPNELGSLSKLEHLNLSYNSLSGEIPHTLSQCSLLQNISLRNNMLYGEIPSNLSLCSELQIIDFQTNNLTGFIPVSLGALKGLKKLLLGNNLLEANEERGWDFLTALTNCSSLQYLELEKNRLAGPLPDSVANLSVHLIFLAMEQNQIYGHIPLGIGKLVNLQVLSLGYNLLGGTIPSSIGEISMLEWFSLNNNQIFGAIPHELGSLSKLVYLDLSNNSLSGEIPHTLSHCSLLQNITLRNNMLYGEIPSNLSLCSKLQIIDFQTNNLTGIIPVSLGALKGLKMLFLGNNLLEANEERGWDFLTALTNCSSLQHLGLGKNRLAGPLPDSVANLSVHLIYLSLGYNQIYGSIALGIMKLVNLQMLYLNDNYLTANIPLEIGKLFNLQALILGNNLLSGTIPPSIGELPKLEWLSLSENQLFGAIPPSFCNLSSLYGLYMDTNHLEGSIPPCIGNLTSLNSLWLNHNNLIGHIPYSLGNLFNLKNIGLHFNNLRGNIPPSLGNLRFLVQLEISFNDLSGFIPDSIWNLTFLEDFGIQSNNLIGTLPMITLPSARIILLQKNNLHGPIPTSLFNSSALEILELFSNYFDGTIHPNIGNLKNLSFLFLHKNLLQARDIKEWSFLQALNNCTNLKKLSLSYNKFEGILPHSIVNLTIRLNALALDFNILSGKIPSDIGNLIGLNWLSLSGNNFTGTIPMEIGKLNSLERLDLDGNSLSGEIPHSLENLSILNLLYLSNNSFSGYIPSSLGRCKQITSLYLDNNKLIGSIPKEIFSITSLSLGVDLANNLLVGSLPINIGLLTNLVYLRVSNNKLVGQIPSNLASCVELIYLYVDNNLFDGNIPSYLRALKSLEIFDVSHNNLTGKIPEFLESLQQLNLSYNHLEGEVPKKGIFLSTSAFSVYGNDKLCGGIVQLSLPPCLISRKKHDSIMLLAIIIPVTCIMLFLIILLILFLLWRNRKSKRFLLSERFEKDQNFIKVSYAELQRATNGFSSHNLIGSGSFGSVYMGNMDRIWQIKIAVKVLNLQQSDASKSFKAECKALRNIRHKNLVRILTSCSSIDHEGNDFKALVFVYMPNDNLDKWLHQQSIFENEIRKNLIVIQRMNIIIDVASALDYLHNHGSIPIVHSDLKPSNILLDEDMVAHVSDFGLARFLIKTTTQFSQSSTGSIMFKGTIGYAAPEYGAANKVSVEGDVYSFGIILLEMFTGKRPTDEIFSDGLNLHVFVKNALPERVMDVVDPYLLLQEEEDDEVGETLLRMKSISKHELQCIISVLRIGLLCSEESPTERMQISQAFNELYAIRNVFLKSANDTPTRL